VAGGSLDDVVQLTVFLLDMASNDRFNSIKREILGHSPAQSTIGVAALAAPGISVEVEGLAAL